MKLLLLAIAATGAIATDDLRGIKCLWDRGCSTTGDNVCTAGTYCYYESSYFSQCREAPYECLSEVAISRAAPDAPDNRKLTDTPHAPEEGSCDCIATNNGPYNGNRWGCASDSDCCNPDAKCSNQKCYLPCAGDVPSASPTVAVGEPTPPTLTPEPCRSVYKASKNKSFLLLHYGYYLDFLIK
jgi:hypothetical protein